MSDVDKRDENNDGPHLDSVIGFLQGQKTEQQRIIKLLEGLALHKDRCEYPGWCEFHCRADTYQFVIELIRGEFDVEKIV